MAKAKGAPKSGGRAKGTPNKKTADLMAICAKHNVEPFEAMIIAATELTDPEKRVNAWEKVSQYLYPKRKALELDIDPESAGFRVVIEEFGKK